MNKFEAKLERAGQLIKVGTVRAGVRVLKVIPPSKYTRVITRCPRCGKTSLFWMGNYKAGRSRCSYGCFKGRKVRAWNPAEVE